MSSGDMEAAISKIRPHTSSSLPHQKAPANLLIALEATFKEQKAERSPAAYFAGLLTALESTVKKERDEKYALADGDLLPAELYLLALVGPFVPAPVVRANLNTLLSLTSPLWNPLNSSAPALRSQLTLYNALLRAADRSQLETPLLGQSFATILQLCVDTRPKIRKRASDLVRDVLASPPSPLLIHPYAERVGEWSVNALSNVNTLGSGKQKGKKNAEDIVGAAIHLLAFLRPVLPCLTPTVLPTITTSLLTLPRLGNPYLSQSAYGVLSDLLSTPDDLSAPRNIDTSPAALLHAITTAPPLKSDVALLPAWVQVVGKAMFVYAHAEPDAAAAELTRVWRTLFAYLEVSDAPTRRETAAALSLVVQCISPSLMEEALAGNDKSALGQILGQLTKALDALAYARAMPELLAVVSAMIEGLKRRSNGRGTPTAAERLLMPLIVKIANLRIEKGFEYKEGADDVLRMAMAVIGPEALLAALPLNLEPEDRAAGAEPRAFLLPLLTQPHPSPLGHFVRYFVPLTERMYDLQQRAEVEGRAAEAKVWSVLVSQVWSGLPAYCYQTSDLQKSLTPQFAQMLSQLMYSQTELRPPVLRALKVIVESNTKPSEDTNNDDPDATPAEEFQQNLEFLRTQVESWFAVLFNVFGSVGRDSQATVGEVISTWAAIADAKEITKTCHKVVGMFKTNLGKMSSISTNAGTEQRTTVAAMQDILVILVPYLSSKDARGVFDLCLSREVLTSADNGVQKRAYKLLGRLVQIGKVNVSSEVEELYIKMDEVADDALAAAKKVVYSLIHPLLISNVELVFTIQDRLTFLKVLLPYLPSNALHVIPSLIPEAVLGTKEPSEKARVAAFELVVAMGYKMREGGVVKRHKLNGMDEDDMTEAPANVQEFFTMMAGGLAGASSHMISATITAISRLVFEFKNDISADLHSELFLTLLEYLRSANREIVKSALGFAKLFIHTSPPDLLLPHLNVLIPALLAWAHDHKNHFKAKVSHIFERLIRRCGWESVYAAAGTNEEGTKILLNIKKRKDRAKRRKVQQREGEGDSADEDASEKVNAAPTATGDAFEDVLYGSESELEGSDDDHTVGAQTVAKKGKKSKGTGARLRIDDDEPMDLLHGANTRITNARKEGRKPGAEASKFKTDEQSGKLLLESDSEAEGDVGAPDSDARLGGGAYHETLTSTDGFTRDSRGRVKFHKDTKKRRRDAADAEGADENVDVEMADGDADASNKSRNKKLKQKQKSSTKIGQEFKAKRAGGDIKKGGVDPYAYLPLSQAAKGGRGKGGQKITVTGRR
ncbi:hypothetical protein EW145_g2754 [Phellinidium pouzarii]|uniref:Uncharacterized protein n=1 Tax=Phellinidium pouzarii TaxID=167371 RepID=A0A4S4L9X3_9AGAM|nr:hypothetical protein EW145_g2754 [Phellinidium pouzarii]